ncbi:MAG TPA: GNAT family N-acetyltransferase [candidate division Zixibacteria bacterium]|nr:GNAT family N-acetyltransferase [candidate division Zixibacteria bacterium]
MLIFSTDKKRLLEHFEKDRVLFAYHIGDLDDFFFEHCQWAVDYEERAHVLEVVLIYSGGDTPVVLALGLTERFAPFLNSLMDLLPARFFCHFRAESRPQLQKQYRESSFGTLRRMKLGNFNLQPDDERIRRLKPSDVNRVRQLYHRAYPECYFTPRMLETGKYFGYEEGGRLLAVAGIHVNSDEHKMAVLGSIATDPDVRGRGLGTLVTSKLIADLDPSSRTICLNVKNDNLPALRSYEKLGFEPVYEFEESLFDLI